MDKDTVLHNLRLARAYCAKRLVWFAAALYQCKIIPTEQVPVAAIDKHYNIYFNPQVVQHIRERSSSLEEAVAQLGFLWIHEISHVIRDHSDRAKDLKAQPKLWNIAADFEINDGQWKGLKMPVDFPGLLPKKFQLPNGKIAEWYYHKVLEDKELQNQCKNCTGEGARKEDKKGEGNKSNEQTSDGNNAWDEGSGVHNESRPWEVGSEQQKLHKIDRELVSKDVAKKMKEHRKQIGTMPGSWGLWVEEILESKTDWRKILRHRMSSAIATGIGLRVDYTFARPSRRQSVYHPIITPSFSGDRSGNIAVVVDTSGSMGGHQLGQAVGEVCKVLQDFNMPVTVIPCDAKAYEPIVLRNFSDRFKIQKLRGGGGTDMNVGINAALALKPKPDTILVLTDGYTPYPAAPHKTPIIFGIIKRDRNVTTPKPNSPPWKESAVVDILLTV